MKIRLSTVVLILIGFFITVSIVYACPQSPLAILTGFREYVVRGRSVTLDGSDSYDPNGSGGINGIWEFEWDFTDNNSYDYSEDCWYGDNAPDGAFDGKTIYTYDANGTYTVRLRVTDANELTDTDTYIIYVSGDTDNDGLPEDWEDLYQELDDSNSADADEDSDSDGYNNLCEYLHGSEPNNASSYPSSSFNITIYVPGEVDSIQRAINASIDGDTVLVSEGTYNEAVDFKGISCTLTSTDPNDWSVVAATTIDSDDPNVYVITFENSEDANSVLKGFTITGGEVGIYCDGVSPTISNCVITNNISTSYGGGMYDCNSSPIITNCIFSGNKAGYGGGIYDVNSSPTLISCVFADNLADVNGAGIYNYGSSPIVINCTFSGNSADGDGGGMYSAGASEPNLTNCIFWGNEALGSGDEVRNDASSDPNFYYCDISECGGSSGWDPNYGSDDGNNIDSDPNFIDVNNPIGPDGIFGTFDDGLRLQIVSPCIDAADGDAAPTIDISGSGRIDVSYVENIGTGDPNYTDIGAYESPTTWFVDVDASAGNGDGTSWGDAFTDLKDALNDADDGDEIWVAEGTYKPDDVNDDRSISFELTAGVGVYGGFVGTEEGRHQRNWAVYTTILSGDIGTTYDMNDNSYHVVKGASNAILDGFWITRGNADGSSPDNSGGGMYNSQASTVMNCFFSDNLAAVSGGGIYNTAGASIINCVFSDNSANYGGGIFNFGSGVEITNCTLSGNEATTNGGGMGSSTYSPTVTNCIFWGDTPDEIYNYNSNSTFSYCDIQGCGGSSSWDPNFGTDLGGNIDSDPCFVDINNPAGADGVFLTWDDGLRLDGNSLCIDAADGDSAHLQDILGLNRIDVNGVDHNGVGGPDYVDMGAYESYSGLDSDSDGMPDDYEIIHGLDLTDSNDANEDLDSDDLSNLLEYQIGTWAGYEDTDRDGMDDGWEHTYALDPLDDSDVSQDADNDGLNNLDEYTNNTDPRDRDSDDDYMLDGWEVNNNLDPLDDSDSSQDLDNDNLINLEEYYIGLDPNDVDTDNDGLNDGLEYENGINPNNSDTDDDGLPDIWEYNNGLNPLDGSDADADTDGDGLTNTEEYDAGTDPKNADSDADGMPDGWEDTYGFDPNDPNDAEGDKDQDDYSNIVEFIHGSDPNDANSLSEPNTIIVPTDVNSIQSAIDVSIAGDVIEVLQGTYYESINFNSETITLTSTDPNIWWIVEGTIIDANAPNVPVVIFDSNDVNSVLTGFTVKGGSNGISCSSSSSPTITKCIIEDNNSHGIYCTSGSPWIVNNMIRLNNGNGIYSSSSTPPPIKNNWIYSNSNGIGFSSAASAAIVRNNTIIYNDSNGIHVDSNTAPTISNCILWNNGDDLVNCTATYSCIEDSNDAGDPNMHNICDDPCFANIFEFLDETTSDGNTTTIIVADANLYDVNDVIEYNNDGTVRTVTDVNTATGTITFANDPLDVNSVAGILIHNWGPDANDLDADFHISANSACINTGDPNADPNYAGEFDIDGQVRVRGENVDMGADEGAVTWYVDIDANGADTGFSWEDAFISIQDAIDTALDGDTIIIAEGTYYESISYSGKTMTVKSTDPEDSDVIAATIIDANDPNDPNDANTPVVIFDSGGSTGSVLSGLTITGGNTGVCCSMLSSPVITNCVIRDNNGLGVRCASSSPIVKNCIITGNSGSGISGGSPTITNCTIVYNGGNGLRDCGGQIRNCIFWGNGYDELYYSSATYSCVEDSNSGEGNINYMPYFTNVGGSDYHLLSYSPCIDTGDPNSDYSNEPNNGGDRINMGAYGNTPEAALASADSDDDNLPDTWELLYWPSIDSNDANDDPDTDNLTNLQEYHIGLDPNDSDTDDDGLWDGWELDNGLNPNNSDTDGDGIPDGWEYNNGLDPLDDSDAEADSDGDGLTNIEEYSIGTSPKNTDSDTDGMPDGWEDSHGFNPMDPNDADGDLDQDGHSNVVEFIHGSDPNDANSLSEPNTITVPTDVNSIQFAIDVSIDGDVIEVLQGTYYESIDFGAKAVTLTGTNPNDWWVVESTVIDGNNANNVVVFDSGEEANSVLTGLMITNGQYGISCSNSSSPTITRCVIEDNNSHGIYCTSGSPEITNNMIGLNEEGDGIYSSSLTPPTIKNNFIYGNSNGIGFSSATSAAIVRNNSIVDNDSNGIHVDSNTAPTISNCILWNNGDDLDNCSATYSCIKNNDAGTGNINGDSNDPLFIDAGGYDYRLQRTSPCINAGDPNADPNYSDETDIEGQVREAKTVDMGADEVCEVHNTTKGEKGTWYSAVDGEGIQDAIDDANNGDVIVVYEWTFNESIHINDVNVTLTSTDPNDWDVVECTIIDADDSDANVVTFDSGQDTGSVLTGLTLTGGKNGIYCDNSSSPTVITCFITDNNSVGVACVSGSPTIKRCKIGENSGDGINSSSTAPPTIKNSLIYKNKTGISFTSATSAAMIRNNTIVDNNGFGIYVGSGTEPNISNCILWGHDGNDLSDCNATYSCIEDSNDANGIGNITNDPMFVNADCNNYCLLPDSPCIDAGDPNADYTGDVDLYGLSLESPKGDGVEMGCSEDPIYRVKWDAKGSEDGSSWDDAFTCLQDALVYANPSYGDSIWVARGTYKPDLAVKSETIAKGVNRGDRTNTFQLVKGVRLLGGFAGHEMEESERDWKLNPTILSGDIGLEGIELDNSYHVVTADDPEIDESTVLDGFTITAGNANVSSSTFDRGGGMYNMECSPTVTNCTFSENSAKSYGGGMYNGYLSMSSPVVTNCTFKDNSVSSLGGGMFNDVDTLVSNCIFSDNSAKWSGGGMYNYSSSPTLTNCLFIGNSAEEVGSGQGGGMYNYCNGTTLINCVFSGNEADQGGGMYNYYCDYPYGTLKVTNCTFNGNSADDAGGAICNYWSDIEVTNCILWGDTPYETHEISSYPTVTYCCVQNDYWWYGEGNIDDDPEFADGCDVLGPDGIFGTVDDGLALSYNSPCIDAGDNDAAEDITVDITDGARSRDGNHDNVVKTDMGAYEYPAPWYVKASADEGGNGKSWASAFKYLQDAFDVAVSGDEIWVAAGTYAPDSSIGGPKATFQLIEGVALYGGFAGLVTETDRDDRDWKNNETYLSGDLGGTKVYHVVTGADNAVLDGFIIKDGSADGSFLSDQSGGGMYNFGVSPIVENCIFKENYAVFGGGIANVGILEDNKACSPQVRNCTFYENTAFDSGAGMFNYESSPEVTNCLFVYNGGYFGYWNSMHNLGGGMHNLNCTAALKIINCTFSNNWADFGGALFNENSSVTIMNCILWDDISLYWLGDEIFNYIDAEGGSHCTVTYSAVDGGLLFPKNYCYYDDGYCEDKPDEGIGNIPCAPYFKDPVNDVYHLESYSPCIDMGNPASDYSNEPDYPNGRINMGAYGNTADATTKGADNDNDGIPDAWESIYGDLDPVNDEDDDNLINIGEYYYGTNPQNVDTDNDNRNDYWEVTYGMDPLEDEDVPECGFYAHDLPYVTSFEPCQKYETLKSVHYQNGWKVYEGSAWINYETMEVTPTEGDPYWLKINYLQLEPGARVGKIFNDEYIPDPYQTNYRMLSVRLIPQVGMYVHVLNGEDIIACIGFLEDKVEVQSWDTVNKVTKLEVDWDWDVDWTGGWGILSFTLDFDGWPHDHYTVHWEDEGLRKQDPLEQYYFGKRFPGSGKAFLAYNHKFLTEVAFYNSPLSENSFCVDRMSLSRDVGILAGLDTKFWSNCYIDSPKGFGQKTYTGEVPITGYIMCSQLGKYEVCFFPNNVWPPLDPTNGADYIRICSGYDIVEEGDTMGTWNLSSLSGGHYNLLLILFWDKYTADENYEHDDPRWNLLYAADCLYEDFRVSNNKVAPSLSFEEVDISVPWPGQFPFELKRTFNNNRRFSKKPFPNGWTHNFQMTISEVTTYQNAAWNEESGFFYQIDDGDCLPFGQIQVTYPDGSTRVFTHKEESEQATTATYYPVEPELSPGDVVTRKPLWYRIEDVPGFWILSIYYELRLSDGTIVRFDNAKYFESFYDTDYDGHNDPMPWIRIDPSEGEEGFMWKVVGGVSSVEDRFGNQLDVEWKKEEVIEGFGEVKPIVVTKVGYKRGDDKTIAIEFEPGEYDYYISAKLKYDGNVYRTINYDWDLYDIGWVFTISAEGKGAGPRDIWSDKDYVLAEYFYKSNMNLRSICRNGKLVTTATYSDDGRLEHREDFVDSEDSELYPWPKHFIYDFEPEEEPSVNLIVYNFTPTKIMRTKIGPEGRAMSHETQTGDGTGAVDLELTYGTGENLNPATKPDEKFEYFDGKTRKTKYDYSDDKNDYWQLEKQYVYEKDGVTETLCARTDLEYNLDYPILVHKKTTYQDLSDLDNSKVETIYVYGDKDGVPSEYGNSGKYLVRQKVLTDQSEDPDEYVETTYKYYEPLNMGGSTQHGGPVLIGRFGSGFGLIKEKIDPEGNRTLYKYDDYGYKTFEKIGPDGSEDPVKRFYHNVIGQLELEADYSGRVTRNYYDDFGRIGIVEVYEDPRAMKLPDNAFVPSTYVDTNTDIKLLSRIRYGYDAVGNRTFQQQEVLAGSPGAEPVLTTRDSIALEYNSGNLLKKVTYESSGDFDDSFVEYSYDSRGNKGTELIHDGITDREWWTLFWYDDMERQFYETSLDYDFSVKRAKVNHYYDTGQKKFEDLHGEHAIIEKLIDYEYDILGRMTKLTVDKGGEGYLNLVTQYSYDDAGNLDHIIDPCENYIYFDYDNANRNTTEYFATDSVTQPTRKKQINYNGNNDITAVTSYDYDGTTALAHKTFDYDNRRRLEKVEEFLEDPEGENPDKAVTTFDYEDPDEAGEEYKITINHPVGTEKTEILSNVLGKVSKVTYPSGKFQDMQYNGDGSLMRKRVFNPVGYDWIDFTYDNYGRLKEVTYPDLPTPGKVTYEYDGFGRRTKVTDNRITDDNIGGSSQIKYDYDVLGRVVKVTDQYDYELYYTYRADGQKEDIAVYKPGQQDPIYWVVYDYDYALRLNAVYEPRLGTDDLIAQLEYDNNGNRDKISYSKDGTAESTVDIDYTYNPDNFLTSFSTTGGRTFTFNATGTSPPDIDGLGRLVDAQEVLTKTDNTTVTYNLDYTYDMRSQLTEADITKDGSPWWDADYTYYKNGNLKDRTTDIPKTEFDYTGEIMNGTKAEGGESFTLTWDKHGNIDTTTLNNGLNFTYNWDDKLRKVEEQDETFVMSVRYDPDGNRIFKKNISEERKYIVDIAGDLPVILMELNNSGGIVKTYIYANSQIIAQHTGDHTANRYFYLHDRLGSVRQVIDTSGNVKNRYTYDPFGELGELFEAEKEETISNPFMFTGQYFDSEIDQYYLRARQYDPHIARFTARDLIFGKIENPITLHTYLYCGNDPLNKIDPWGLWTFHCMVQGLASFGGSLTGAIGFVIDEYGNHELIRSFGIGVGVPSVGEATTFGMTSAPSVYDLSGIGSQYGGSVSIGFMSAGIDFLFGRNYWGAEVTFGYSFSLPLEYHYHILGTAVGDYSFSNFYESYENDVLERQIYEVQNLLQWEAVLFTWGTVMWISGVLD